MNLETATKATRKILGTKQDPDKVTYTKQWDVSGGLKGWMIGLYWNDTEITLDMTRHYTRIIGDLDAIPDFIKGKHQRVCKKH